MEDQWPSQMMVPLLLVFWILSIQQQRLLSTLQSRKTMKLGMELHQSSLLLENSSSRLKFLLKKACIHRLSLKVIGRLLENASKELKKFLSKLEISQKLKKEIYWLNVLKLLWIPKLFQNIKNFFQKWLLMQSYISMKI